jgi:geranylgeranyl reductase family protein
VTVDVAIAGGGPAGSSAALALAEAGLQTLIIDKSQFPRNKACGEYLSAGAVEQLRELGLEHALSPPGAPLDGIRLSGNGARVELRFSQPGWALPRTRLDDEMLRAALGRGAVFLQARIEDVREVEAGSVLTIREPSGETRDVRARFVIGADGAQSIVARKSGLSVAAHGEQRFALGGHYAGLRELDRFVEMFVEGHSYFAVNPFDAAHANIMVIVREKDLTARKNDVDRFIRERARALSGDAARFAEARLEGPRVAVGPLAHSTRAVTTGNILLAGDAAGFIDPFTGQGVYLALRAGMAAARTIAAAVAEPSSARAAIERYSAELSGEMRRRGKLARIVRSFVGSAALSKRAARNVGRDPERAQVLIDAIAGCGPVEPALRLGNLLRLVA